MCDPRASARSVSEIAFAWGFNDAAHFSRAFKNRFGCSPRDMRARALPLQPG
nr:helix-turn-helix domain-containing protein [Comamonas sp. SCN 65-56]